MLYYLTHLKIFFSPFNILNYISFRAGGSILTAFFITIWLGPRFIRYVKANRVMQVIRAEGPSTHQSKSGTPIMAMRPPDDLWLGIASLAVPWCIIFAVLIFFAFH